MEWTSAQKIFRFHLISQAIFSLKLFRNQRKKPTSEGARRNFSHKQTKNHYSLLSTKLTSFIMDNILFRRNNNTKPYISINYRTSKLFARKIKGERVSISQFFPYLCIVFFMVLDFKVNTSEFVGRQAHFLFIPTFLVS